MLVLASTNTRTPCTYYFLFCGFFFVKHRYLSIPNVSQQTRHNNFNTAQCFFSIKSLFLSREPLLKLHEVESLLYSAFRILYFQWKIISHVACASMKIIFVCIERDGRVTVTARRWLSSASIYSLKLAQYRHKISTLFTNLSTAWIDYLGCKIKICLYRIPVVPTLFYFHNYFY